MTDEHGGKLTLSLRDWVTAAAIVIAPTLPVSSSVVYWVMTVERRTTILEENQRALMGVVEKLTDSQASLVSLTAHSASQQRDIERLEREIQTLRQPTQRRVP